MEEDDREEYTKSGPSQKALVILGDGGLAFLWNLIVK